MILQSIQVRAWRCFPETIQVGPFSSGLNVIHAPNGKGKSTLFEALRRGLIDSHGVGGRDVEALRPWGRSLAPVVTIEFAHGGTEYRLTKGFLENSRCELERNEGGRFVLFAEGDAADRFTQELMTKSPPQRGLAKREHWGLAQVLWVPQGELAFSSLSGDLVADIQQVLGVQVSGPGSGKLEQRIAELYGQYFTNTGRLRSGQSAPRLVQLQENRERAQKSYQEALAHQQEFEELARKVEDLRAKQAEATRTSEEFEKMVTELRPRAEAYAKLVSSRSERQEQVKAAEAQHDALKQRTDSITTTRKDLAEAKSELEGLTEEVGLRERDSKKRQAGLERAKASLEDIRTLGRPKEEEAREEAELARKYLEAMEAASGLERRITKAQELSDKSEKLGEQRSKLVAPDDNALKALRNAIRGRDEAQLRLDAALITLQIVPLKKGKLTVVEAEETGSRSLAPEEAVEVKGSPRVVVDLSGVGRIRAWGPTGSIDEIREALEEHSGKVAGLAADFGTSDIEELERLNDMAGQLDKEIGQLDSQVEAILSGESLGSLKNRHAKFGTVTQAILKERPKWKTRKPDLGALGDMADTVRNKFIADVEGAEREWTSATDAHAAVQSRMAEAEARRTETKKRVGSLQRSLGDLADDGKTDAQRARELSRLARTWEAAGGAVEEVEGQLATFESDPRKDLEKQESLRSSAQQEALNALSEEKKQEGQLEQLSAQGTYSSLGKIEEQLAALDDEIGRENLRASAARLLYETVEESRAVAIAAVAKPVEQAATRTLQRIVGGRLGSIELGDAFEPAQVSPQIAGGAVPISNVSGGEKEQIFLATRLALAEILAQDEPQLVVLDDVLTATDAGRLGRILTVLEEAADKLQIVILTCHPERYGGLEGAKRFDLEEIMRV